jgi:hypothetical protein
MVGQDLDTDRAGQPVEAADQGDDEPLSVGRGLDTGPPIGDA